METPLPEKIKGDWSPDDSFGGTLNQLITYLNELTAIVEALDKPTEVEAKGFVPATLKETLLIEMRELFSDAEEFEDRVEISDVEDIINRVLK